MSTTQAAPAATLGDEDPDSLWVEIDAEITGPHGDTERVYAGSVQAWAWDLADYQRTWKRSRRDLLIGDRTAERPPRGWTVRWIATDPRQEY